MSPAIGAFIGVSKQTEMLLMTVLALWVNIFDMAIFEMSSNLDQVWNVEIDKEIFNSNAEYVIRMLLSGVVLIRTFTLHLYIAFLIAVFWPVCFGTRPTLMLPWLVVSAIKNLGTGLVSIATGGYTCMIYGPLRPACVRFLLSQIIDLSPSFYMWFVGLSLYCDLKKPKSVSKLQIKAMEDQELNVALRRRKVKSMIDEDILRQQFESRSFQKKFLGTSAVEVNEFINRCSYDNLKNKFSRSLDSLLDVLTVQTELLDIEDSEPLEIDSSSTLQQKTAKLLGISMDEIDCIKQNRQTRIDFPAYPIQPQKKIPAISLINSRFESPAKLLPETSLYSPPNKLIRITKSELKSAKDDFSQMDSIPEKEIQVHDFLLNESVESLSKMQTVCQTNDFLHKPSTSTSVGFVTTNMISNPLTNTKDYGIINHNSFCRNQNRGNLEEVQIENSYKYKFSNTLSDNSHYLLDEYSFLFDKESMLKKAEQSKVVSLYTKRLRLNDQNYSKGKQKRFKVHNNIIDVAATITNTFQGDAFNKKPTLLLDEIAESKNNETDPLKKTKQKEDVLYKKNCKLSERNQMIKKKIVTKKMPSSEYSNIPVFRRNHRNFEKSKNTVIERNDNINKNRRNRIIQENTLSIIEENKEAASLVSNQKAKPKTFAYVIRANETKGKTKPDFILKENNTNQNVLSNEENKNNAEDRNKCNNENVMLKEEKRNKFIGNNEVKKIENTFYNKESENVLEDYKISVPAEIERLNQRNLNILSSSRKDVVNIVPNSNKTIPLKTNKIEMLNTKHYLRSLEYRYPVPYICIKHFPVKNTFQKEAVKQEPKLFFKEENKFNVIKTPPTSKKILEQDKNTKTESNLKTELFKNNTNKNEFEFAAAPVKASLRNKQLEFHFKEKISKSRDCKIEDLFKKKIVSDKKDERDKTGFPSYFSNKINRIITDACQIRKKSCKKINLFCKVSPTTNIKHRNKHSTVELFRKQTPPKNNIFDITGKLSIGELVIPPFRGDKCNEHANDSNKYKSIPNKLEINLFNPEGFKTELAPNNALKSQSTNPVVLVQSGSSSTKHSINNAVSNTEDILLPDIRNTESLINSFMLFDSYKNSREVLPTLSVAQSDGIKMEEQSDGAKVIKETESPCKINLFEQNKFKIGTDCPGIKKKSRGKTTNYLSTNKENFRCKKLSEQAINKIISLTNTSYSNHFNKELETFVINKKSSESKVYENCKKLSDFAIDKLLSITSEKYALEVSNKDKHTNIMFPIIENDSNAIVSSFDSLFNSTNNTVSGKPDSKLKAAEAEINNSLNLKKTPTMFNSPTLSPNHLKIGPNYIPGIEVNDSTDQQSFKTTVSLTNNLLVRVPEKNKNNSYNKTLMSTYENKNYNWISQDCINIFASNINSTESKSNSEEDWCTLDDEDEEVCAENLSKEVNFIKVASREESSMKLADLAKNACTLKCESKNTDEMKFVTKKEENVSSYKDDKLVKIDEKPCNEMPINASEYLTNIPIVKIERECQGTSNHRIKLISSTISKFKNTKNINQFVSPRNANIIKIKREMNPKNKNIVISSLLYNSHIPIKEEKICRGTSQHNIKLISSIKQESSSDTNFCRDKKESLHSKDELSVPVRVQKVCKGSSQNYIKFISQSKDGHAKPNNFSHNETISKILKEYQTVPIMKEEKICNGALKHKIKLVSSYKKSTPSKMNLFRSETEYKNNKNENITIIKEEKVSEGSLQHSIKLFSSSSHDAQNKTIFIVKKELPSSNENIFITKDNMQNSSTKNHAIQTNLFVNVSTENGNQSLTVIQKQENSKKSDKQLPKYTTINKKEWNVNKRNENTNLRDENNMKAFRNISVVFKAIQCYLEKDAKKLLENDLSEKVSDFETINNDSNVNFLIDIKSSEILSSLIHKVETSLKQSNNEGLLTEKTTKKIKANCPKYHSNQIDFGCQTSPLSNKLLDCSPIDLSNKLSRTKSIVKSHSAKSYQDLNSQKIAFSMTVNRNCNGKSEAKETSENLSKDDKRNHTNARGSRNSSYISIHKERLAKAKIIESDLNRNTILSDCSFLEDGYTRLHNLLGVQQEPFKLKSKRKRKNLDSSLNF